MQENPYDSNINQQKSQILSQDNQESNIIKNRNIKDTPQFMNTALFGMCAPTLYYFYQTGFANFYSMEYTNAVCMMLDWTGLTIASFTGGYYFYSLFKHQKETDKFERKPHFKTLIGINMTGILASMYLIQDLNIFAVMPIFVSALMSMPLCFQSGDIFAVHKGYISFYLKYTLILTFCVLMVGVSQMSFYNYKDKMRNQLKEYSSRAEREFKEQQEQQQSKQEIQQIQQNKK